MFIQIYINKHIDYIYRQEEGSLFALPLPLAASQSFSICGSWLLSPRVCFSAQPVNSTAAVRLCEQRQVIKVEPSVSLGCQPNVDDVIGAGYKADKSCHEEHHALRRILRIGNGERAHDEQARAHDQERKGGQHCAPVFAHLRMPPAICVGLLRGQVAVLLDERIAVPGGCVLGILIVAPGGYEK